MAGFRSAAPWFGLSVGTGQAGYRNALPAWQGGARGEQQGGFRTPLPTWNAGAGEFIPPEPTPPETSRSGGSRFREKYRNQILRKDEEILAVIMSHVLH